MKIKTVFVPPLAFYWWTDYSTRCFRGLRQKWYRNRCTEHRLWEAKSRYGILQCTEYTPGIPYIALYLSSSLSVLLFPRLSIFFSSPSPTSVSLSFLPPRASSLHFLSPFFVSVPLSPLSIYLFISPLYLLLYRSLSLSLSIILYFSSHSIFTPSLFLFPSLIFSLTLSLSLSVYLSLSLTLSVFLSLSVSFFLSLSSLAALSLSPFFSLPSSPSYRCIFPSLTLPLSLTIFLSLFFSLTIPIDFYWSLFLGWRKWIVGRRRVGFWRWLKVKKDFVMTVFYVWWNVDDRGLRSRDWEDWERGQNPWFGMWSDVRKPTLLYLPIDEATLTPVHITGCLPKDIVKTF